MKKILKTILVFIFLVSMAICFDSFPIGAKINLESSAIKVEDMTKDMEINEYLEYINKISVIVDGKKKILLLSDNEFRLLISEMEYILSDCHDMPAFGVSLHEDTMNAMKSGKWVEFSFPETMEHNEMPFDAWLIGVEKDFSGFNIIRKTDGRYEGRCYYMRLMNGKTMAGLYGIIEDMK